VGCGRERVETREMAPQQIGVRGTPTPTRYIFRNVSYMVNISARFWDVSMSFSVGCLFWGEEGPACKPCDCIIMNMFLINTCIIVATNLLSLK
jgi:hypothetical protein